MSFLRVVILLCLCLTACRRQEAPILKPETEVVKALLFTKTNGFRHEAIPAGIAMFNAKKEEWKLAVTETEDVNLLTSENLAQFKLIILLNTTGSIFKEDHRNALKNYIHSGGAVLGIHAAADAEYGWPWYNQMLGAWFDNHPEIQAGTCKVQLSTHSSVKGIPPTWQRTDEWYNFRALQPDNNVVITVDESTYSGGSNGSNHPISWYRNFEGGKIFYTAMGHTSESYTDSLFVQHIGGAITWLLQ